MHFAVNLFTALVFFAVFWLYYDAWTVRREWKETIKLIGLFLLSLSFVASAITVETTLVVRPIFMGITPAYLSMILRNLGYVTLIVSLLIDPLQAVPHLKKHSSVVVPLTVGAISIGAVLQPILAVSIALLYLKRATVGLEDHLKPLAWSFGVLSISELISMAYLFQSSTNVSIYQLVAPFGPVWILVHILVFLTAILLCRWVFGYLLKQFEAQLFMVYTTTILTVFLVTTVSFTGLLLRNMESEASRQIATDVKVLDFAIASQKEQEISDAVSLSQDPSMLAAFEKSDRKALGDFATAQLITKKLSVLVITTEAGQVVARGEDRDRLGDSLSGDSLVKRGLLGETTSTVISKDGVIAPEISIRAVSPIYGASKAVIGAIVVGRAIDTAFVDGLKKATDLDASIYGGNIVSATTFTSTDGRSRIIGMKEEHADVKNKVLTKGEAYSGSLPVRETVYTAAFLPLKDVDNNPVGMLFVGRPQSAILQAAGSSIQFTFIITSILLVASIFPAYGIAKYITNQL